MAPLPQHPAAASPAHPRLVILGLDGVSVRLIHRLAASGRCPALAEIAPLARPMHAHLPELSPVNWTSFATAAPPGEHGIYGFTDLDPATGTLVFPDGRHRRLPTLFARLSEAGFFAKALNLPALAPVPPCRAVLVAGFPATDLRVAVWPTPMANLLAAHGYRIEADTRHGLTDPGRLLADLRATLAHRRQALSLLWEDLAWDLFVVVFTEVDRLGHFLYPALEEDGHPWQGACLELMAELDAAVGEVLERFHDLPHPKRLMGLADHGMTSLVCQFDLNAWLVEHKLQTRTRAAASPWDTAAALNPATVAIALDPGRIYFHTRGRFPHGRLRPQETRRLAEDLASALRTVTSYGRPLVQQVFFGEDLYGPHAVGLVPDLVLLPAAGVELQGKMDSTLPITSSPRHGVHTAHDVLWFDTWGHEATTPARAGQNVLEHFGWRPPSSLLF